MPSVDYVAATGTGSTTTSGAFTATVARCTPGNANTSETNCTSGFDCV